MPSSHRWLGAGVLLALFAHVVVKVVEHKLGEVLWSCHVASAALGVGLVMGSWRLAAPGFLYHIAMGMPAYLLDLAAGATTNPTGIATHVASLFFGVAAAWTQPLPWRVMLQTWIAYALLLPVTALLADPELNVNQVSKPWLPLGGVFDYKLVYLSINVLLAGVALTVARRAWVWIRERRRVAVTT